MSAKLEVGDRVMIITPTEYLPIPPTSLSAKFEGRRGTVIAEEGERPTHYRVQLDEPIEVEGLGSVRDDLWTRPFLKKRARN